jgi:hypothetical protein
VIDFELAAEQERLALPRSAQSKSIKRMLVGAVDAA